MSRVVVIVVTFLAPAALAAQTADELRKQAQTAADAGKLAEAAETMSRFIALKPDDPEGYRVRGQLYEATAKYNAAASDYVRAIQLDPKEAKLYQWLGGVEFKRGKFVQSVSAFDKYIELVPSAKISHWQRGISHYYAGQWDNGIAQFEGYQTYDSNDVENAVWRFMCMARKSGIAKARKEILPIGDDRRVPMRQVYDLYAGKLTPDDVLTAAKAGSPNQQQRNSQLFYAHLYVGIYRELEGNKKAALEHLQKATEDHRIGHYMWDVARVHRDVLRKELGKKDASGGNQP